MHKMTMFTSSTTHVLLSLLVYGTTVQGPVLYDGCSEPMSRDSAAACCRSRGSVPPLPTPMTLEDNNLLYDRLFNANMSGTWLGLKRVIMDKYQWVNGTGDEFPEETAGKNCAAINITSKVKEAEFCSTEDHGYICERKGCAGCASLGIWKDICVKDGGRCFIVFCERESWFNARSRCIEQGWELATTVNVPALRATSRCPLYWIGLRREKWILDDGVEHINHTSWGVGQPASEGHCARFKRHYSGEFEWAVVECSEPNFFICQVYNDPAAFQTTIPIKKSETTEAAISIDSTTKKISFPEGSQVTLVLVIVLTAVLLVLVFIAMLGLLFIRMRRPKRKYAERKDRSKEDTELEDRERLLHERPQGKGKNIRQKLAEEYCKYHAFVEHFSWDEDLKTLPIEHIYTDLVWTHKTGSKKLECYSDLLKREINSSRVLLRGDAGTGKTTLCRKIVTDWGNTIMGKNTEVPTDTKVILQQFDFVILITLRTVSKDQTLSDIISSQLKLQGGTEKELIDRIESNESNTLFILDGYDEYDPNTSADVTDLVNRKKFPRVNLLLTTRDLACSLLTNKTAFMKQALLLGFSKESGVKKYVKKYFEANNIISEELLTKINESEDLSDLSVFPAVLHLMCILWRENKSLCITLTAFYDSYVRYVLERHDQKESTKDRQTDVLRKYEENLIELGKLSVSGMKGTRLNLAFTKKDVDKFVKGSTLRFGFLTGDFGQTEKSREQYFMFIHKSIQEYFAASYISRLPELEKRELFEQLFGSADPLIESSMTIRFLAGLDGQSVSDMIEGVHKENAVIGTHMMIILLAEIPRLFKNKKLPEKVHLKLNQSYTSVALRRFLKLDGSATKELVVETNNAESCWLLGYLYTPKLETLIIKRNLSVRPVPVIDKNIWTALGIPFKTVHNYELRDFDRCDMSDIYTAELCKELPKAVKIHSLDFSKTVMLTEMGQKLAQAFSNFEELTSLRLRDCTINEENLAKRILDGLALMKNPEKLQVLELSGNRPNYAVLQRMLQLLPRVSMLRELYIFDVNPGKKEIKLRWENLKELELLKTLDVGANCIGKKCLGKFCSSLKTLCNLELLKVRTSSTLSFKNLNDIIQTLITHSSLKTFDLCSNPVNEHVLTGLVEVLTYGSIETLIVKSLHKSVTAEKAFIILENASKYKNLKRLEFPGAFFETMLADFLNLPDNTFMWLRELILPGVPFIEEYRDRVKSKVMKRFPDLYFEI